MKFILKQKEIIEMFKAVIYCDQICVFVKIIVYRLEEIFEKSRFVLGR